MKNVSAHHSLLPNILQTGRESLGSTGDLPVEEWSLEDFLSRGLFCRSVFASHSLQRTHALATAADIRFQDEVGKRRAQSIGTGQLGQHMNVPPSQRALKDRIELSSSVVPVVMATQEACSQLEIQTTDIRNGIKGLEGNISSLNGVPPLFAQLEKAMHRGEEYEIQETLREFKEACRCVVWQSSLFVLC